MSKILFCSYPRGKWFIRSNFPFDTSSLIGPENTWLRVPLRKDLCLAGGEGRKERHGKWNARDDTSRPRLFFFRFLTLSPSSFSFAPLCATLSSPRCFLRLPPSLPSISPPFSFSSLLFSLFFFFPRNVTTRETLENRVEFRRSLKLKANILKKIEKRIVTRVEGRISMLGRGIGPLPSAFHRLFFFHSSPQILIPRRGRKELHDMTVSNESSSFRAVIISFLDIYWRWREN